MRCCSSCLLLTGCAENPTEDIVVTKNEGKLEQAIQEKIIDSDASVPEKYIGSVSGRWRKIEVSVDASVTGLEGNKTGGESKVHMNKKRQKQWADVLFEGATGI